MRMLQVAGGNSESDVLIGHRQLATQSTGFSAPLGRGIEHLILDFANRRKQGGRRRFHIDMTGGAHCGTTAFRNDSDDIRTKSRSEEHTSELQTLMRTSYAVFCLNKKTKTNKIQTT